MKIEHASRDVIEKVLLDRVGEGRTVAILASKRDLDLFIVALVLAEAQSTSTKEEFRELRKGLQSLQRAAFPE